MLAHFMKSVKRTLKDLKKRNTKFCLFYMGLLINAKHMAESNEILYDGYVVVLSEKCTTLSESHEQRLTNKINNFDTSCQSLSGSIENIITSEDSLHSQGYNPEPNI